MKKKKSAAAGSECTSLNKFESNRAREWVCEWKSEQMRWVSAYIVYNNILSFAQSKKKNNNKHIHTQTHICNCQYYLLQYFRCNCDPIKMIGKMNMNEDECMKNMQCQIIQMEAT